MAIRLAALDGAGKLDRAAEQQQLFGQGGLAGVGMRNDGERAAARRALGDDTHEVLRGGAHCTRCRDSRRLRSSRQYARLVGAQPFEELLLRHRAAERSEEHTSELQSLMRISYAVFCWKKK